MTTPETVTDGLLSPQPRRTGERPLEDPFDVMFTGWSFFRSKLLTAAMDLGVFAALGDDSLGAAELADRAGLHPRGARDFLDALAAIGLLVREDGRYRNSPGTLRHLLPDREGFVGGFLRMTTELMGSDPESFTGLLRGGTARNQEPAARSRSRRSSTTRSGCGSSCPPWTASAGPSGRSSPGSSTGRGWRRSATSAEPAATWRRTSPPPIPG